MTFPELPEWLRAYSVAEIASDEDAVDLALTLADRNVAERSGGPFGAVIYDLASFKILGLGINVVERSSLSVLHAEVVAVIEAQRRHGGHHALKAAGAGLACSCQPCVMCLGAIHWAGLRKIVFSASKDDAEAIGFDEGPGVAAILKGLKSGGVEVVGGIAQSRGQNILREYARRGGPIY